MIFTKRFFQVFLLNFSLLVNCFAVTVSLDFDIRKPATIFNVMDNVSLWKEAFCDPAYKSYWQERFKINDNDQQLFDEYRVLREKYFAGEKDYQNYEGEEGIFIHSSALKEDEMAYAFYGSLTLEESFDKLQVILEREEINFLKKFYDHFNVRCSYILNQEKLHPLLINTKKVLVNDKVTSFLDYISAFYQVKDPVYFTVLFTWYPPISQSKAFVSGNFLVLCNPAIAQNFQGDESDIVMHGIIHVFSRQQPNEQKQQLTKAFFKAYPLTPSLPKYHLIEEPLAVAIGQMLYLSLFDPEKFLWNEKKEKDGWYMNEWINEAGREIFPLVKHAYEKKKYLKEELMVQMVKALYDSRNLEKFKKEWQPLKVQ